jgi:hypothetical protein
MNTTTHCCGSESPKLPTCCSASSKKKPWYKTGLFLIACLTGALLSASFFFPKLRPFYDSFMHYAHMVFLPVIIGFLLGGLIDHFVAEEYISKHLAVPKKRTILYSVGLGFLMSACCHGVLAISMEVHKKGASGPAVVSFLLASPWANLPITILLFGFFGWKALLIVGGALLIALNTGLILQGLEHFGKIEKNLNSVTVDQDFSILKDVTEKFRNYRWTREAVGADIRGVWTGIRNLIDMILIWILIGMVLAGLISAFVPPHIFHQYLGPTLLGLFVTLGMATVIEVCSQGTAPLAFEIYRQTGAFGNAFAFLMAGVVTNFTQIALVWKNIGRRTALWMFAVTLPQVMLLGWIFNKF